MYILYYLRISIMILCYPQMHNLSTQTRCIAVLGCASADSLGHGGANPLFWVAPMATKISPEHVEQIKYHFRRICLEFIADKHQYLNDYMIKQLRSNVRELLAAAAKDGSQLVIDTAKRLNFGEILMALNGDSEDDDIHDENDEIDDNDENDDNGENDNMNIEKDKNNDNNVNNEEDNKNDDDMDTESENNVNNEEDNKNDDDMDIESENNDDIDDNYDNDDTDDNVESDMDCDEE